MQEKTFLGQHLLHAQLHGKMNCRLVLLLLGALCTIGCVRAIQEITVNDAKRAVDVAWDIYDEVRYKKVFKKPMTLSNGQKITVECNFGGDYRTRFDCGILPRSYQMQEKNYDALKDLFQEAYPQLDLRKPQRKSNQKQQINAVVGNFNFHLNVGHFKTQMNLLYHLLQSAMRARE